MARIKKKGTSGNARNFITRTQAVRKLQISLPDFRRLCIFKGIYPREPRNKKKVAKGATPATTFYYTKDIQYLLHEPLLNKFREHKALAKKIGRALGRGEVGDAVRLEKSKPRMTLDHVIKERYPTFVDALRDLDDALSMLFLFANLPSTAAVPPKTIALCQKLTLEFQHYIIVSHSLRKSFLSIKGIYYQATVQGQDILWLVPYKFVQNLAGDIDFRIMGTFIEFYTTLLGFVNYRLYTTIGLVYPPKFSNASDERGGELGAFTLEGRALGSQFIDNGSSETGQPTQLTITAQAEADKLATLPAPDADEDTKSEVGRENEADTVDEAIDTFQPTSLQDADVLPQPQFSTSTGAATLFSDFTFFLSRETPKAPLEFLLKAFGCKRIGWDSVSGDGAFTTDEKDVSITHQIVDRPYLLPQLAETDVEDDEDRGEAESRPSDPRVPGRTYIQPQWVWDCVNQGKLLRPDLYAPGATLPPHLSPWVKAKKGEYDPTVPLEEQELEGEAELQEEEVDEPNAKEAAHTSAVVANGTRKVHDSPGNDATVGEGMDVDDTDSAEDDNEEVESENDQDSEEISENEVIEEESNEEQEQYQRELEAEATGLPFTTADSGRTPAKGRMSETRRKLELKKRAEQEELDRQRMMMPNKKRKLFDRMNYSNRARDAEAEKLRKKRRIIEKSLKAKA